VEIGFSLLLIEGFPPIEYTSVCVVRSKTLAFNHRSPIISRHGMALNAAERTDPLEIEKLLARSRIANYNYPIAGAH
jgi:hypothetical protein